MARIKFNGRCGVFRGAKNGAFNDKTNDKIKIILRLGEGFEGYWNYDLLEIHIDRNDFLNNLMGDGAESCDVTINVDMLKKVMEKHNG